MISYFENINNQFKFLIPYSEALIDFSKNYLKDNEPIEVFSEMKRVLVETEGIIKLPNIKDAYLSHISYRMQGFMTNIHATSGNDKIQLLEEIIKYAAGEKILPVNYEAYKKIIKELRFTIDFFKQLGFLNENIVAVGANGSGKSTLTNLLKDYMEKNCTIISAQKFLLIPVFNSIKNHNTTFNELQGYQKRDKTYKKDEDYKYLQNEFQIVLENIFADNNSKSYNYRNQARFEKQDGKVISDPIETNLDKTIEIWNSLISHRQIFCQGGTNFELKISHNNYHANKMSDGEKVLLFHIAQVLQAQKNSFIIIDEPELFLHKTIIKKLWDSLESERNDCIFIYLTHDLDFATSRKTAKKLWIKSYTHPEEWEIEAIPENEIPENLLLEIVGSRKNLLFCEGNKGSNDEQIFNYLLPEFTIVPVGSCTHVINYTRAFNKISNINIQAIGLIDSDFREPEELVKLKSDKIFAMKVAEIENLFFSENFLSLLEKNEDELGCVEKIKKLVIQQLEKDKQTQVSNYVSSKINTFFNNSHISKGNTFDEIKTNFDDFVSKIEIDKWYKKKLKQIEKIIEDKDYESAISIYNNKGLRRLANQVFKITNFEERAFKLLQKNNEARNTLRSLFPDELIEIHNNSKAYHY